MRDRRMGGGAGSCAVRVEIARAEPGFFDAVGAIKARFSISCRRAGFSPPPPVSLAHGGATPARRHKGEVGVRPPRFWAHHTRDAADHKAHVQYCRMPPKKHGYVARPEDWTSARAHRDARFRTTMDLAP